MFTNHIKFRSPVRINPLTKMRIQIFLTKPRIKCNFKNAVLMNILFLFIFSMFCITPAFAEPVTLAWNPNEEPEVIGYNVYFKNHINEDYRLATEIFEADFDNPLFPEITFWGLNAALTYYYVATAFDGTNESGHSNEVIWSAPKAEPKPEKKKSGSGGGGGGCFIGTLMN